MLDASILRCLEPKQCTRTQEIRFRTKKEIGAKNTLKVLVTAAIARPRNYARFTGVVIWERSNFNGRINHESDNKATVFKSPQGMPISKTAALSLAREKPYGAHLVTFFLFFFNFHYSLYFLTLFTMFLKAFSSLYLKLFFATFVLNKSCWSYISKSNKNFVTTSKSILISRLIYVRLHFRFRFDCVICIYSYFTFEITGYRNLH